MNEDFNSNPNQKKIKINKEKYIEGNADTYYAKINLKALQNAMHTLTPKAFELWIYFSKNIDGHTFYLSKVDFLNWSNVKGTSYYNAFKELQDNDYLVPIDEENEEPKHFNFYEIPKEKLNIEITINKVNEETFNKPQTSFIF